MNSIYMYMSVDMVCSIWKHSQVAKGGTLQIGIYTNFYVDY